MKYQQGDVLLKLVAFKESSSRKEVDKKDSLVLAEGEATGHLHQIPFDKQLPNCTVLGYNDKYRWKQENLVDYINVLGDSAVMYHEEHNPLTIPEGFYKVSIVREYDPMSQTTRSVYD